MGTIFLGIALNQYQATLYLTNKKMKKTILALVTMAAFNILFSQNITGKITYLATIVPTAELDLLNDKLVIPSPLKEFEMKSGMDAIPINFHLIFSGKESLYKAEYDIMTSKKLGLLMNQTNLLGQSDAIYYTNLETKEKLYHGYWTPDVLVDMDAIDWQLSHETKKIGKYTCYKATATIDSKQTTGRNFLSPVIAWYTPQIPVSFGIQAFVGLPGLTLELIADYEEGKIQYYAFEIELNPETEIDIERPKAKRTISEKEFIELIEGLNAKRKI